MLRMEITDELQRQFQERAAILDQEVQAARGELNKLRSCCLMSCLSRFLHRFRFVSVK